MASLQDWVSDQLHGLLGMSEKNLVEYIIALAKRSRDEPSLLSSLRDNGVAITDDSRRFAVQLMKKVPRAQVDNKAAEQAAALKQQEKDRQQKQIELLKKNREYTLLENDEADLAAAAAAVETKRLHKLERKEEKREAKKEKKETKRNLRKKGKWSEDEAEGEDAGGEPAPKKAKLEDDDADDALEEWELEELERVRDRLLLFLRPFLNGRHPNSSRDHSFVTNRIGPLSDSSQNSASCRSAAGRPGVTSPLPRFFQCPTFLHYSGDSPAIY
jgi:pre-mRNA-splicing factor ATP-dependent RNA helicase DHX16